VRREQLMTTRRTFLLNASAAAAASACAVPSIFASGANDRHLDFEAPLKEFDYGTVDLAPGLAQTQFEQTQKVLLEMNEDAMLKPWRLRAGLPAPGPDMGGWYDAQRLDSSSGFAPAEAFGQWVSALSRGYAITRDPRTKAKVERILALYEPTISPLFYKNFPFPAYNYDKTVLALIDAKKFLGTPNAFAMLDRVTDAAEPWLPPGAVDRGEPQRKWRASIGEDTSDGYTWDESYTMAENLYLAADRGAGERYLRMAQKFLLNENWFDPLSENKNVLADHHAYSFCNSMSSAMQAWLSAGSRKHLRAATNAFRMLQEQSFATGGWGPDESFVAPGSGKLFASLTKTHQGFETPCGSYAHFKITRSLLRVTQDGRYGDSMERVLYNTVLGVKPLLADGHTFYYSDYNFNGKKVYFSDRWPCCSGTLPQVAADYRVLIYFHNDRELYVNLYLPSTVRWTHADGAEIALTQTSNYPIEGKINFTMRTSRAANFKLRLRIPSWVSESGQPFSIRVNGAPTTAQLWNGFAILNRSWKDGDRIELNFPLPLRLESIDPEHPNTVALVHGPLVLFPLTNEGPLTVSREQLIGAKQIPDQNAWQIDSAKGKLTLLPFTSIEDQSYTTYVNLA
jgi:uncharacterized protein